jgi:archaellum biogenesis ATPase FlaH
LAKVNFGEFWIVTGQEGRGKTTLMKQQLLEWAKQDVPCLLWCAEMPIRQIARQYVQAITSTRKQDLTQETLAVAYEQIADVPLYVAYPSMDPNITSLISIMTSAYREYDVRIFVVDNLMMLTMNARSNEVHHEQGRVAKALKEFAVYNDCSVFLVAHPKKPERDDDERVETANVVSGSKMVMQLADNAFTVFRKSQQAKHSSELDSDPAQLLEPITSIVPLKARDSAGQGIPKLYFEENYSRFREAIAADYDGIITLR